MIELFPDLPIISHKQKETIANLRAGEIDDLRVSNQLPIDDIVKFGLKEGFLKEGLKSFPDPRKTFDRPIVVLLLPQVLQRFDDEHSLLLAPYMLNSAELMTEQGALLLMDRGFLDGEWITHLKINRKIGICMQLKSNSEITQFAVS